VAQFHRRVQELERELLRARSLREAFAEVVRREAEVLPPIPEPPAAAQDEGEEPCVAMLDISDAHAGELVTSEETGGINAYDMGAFRERAATLVRRAEAILVSHPEARLPPVMRARRCGQRTAITS
jgi:hypothetical protein